MTEADMVAAWLEQVAKQRQNRWTPYAETAGWDVLLVHEQGYQVGIEAKLKLNPRVLAQAIDGSSSYWSSERGPDYRAVLVPADGVQRYMEPLARALGIIVLLYYPASRGVWRSLGLPDEDGWSSDIPHWCPAERCRLPDYVPDVRGGSSAPVALTSWKIKAIKLLIMLDRFGSVTRRDMKALQISPTRWCDHYSGMLAPAPEKGGYIRCRRTPDLRAQHPVNYAEIEADFDTWITLVRPLAVAA